MYTLSDIHQQFAECFPNKHIKPYAYLLSKRLMEGHTCIERHEIMDASNELPYLISSLPTPSELHPLAVPAPNTNAPFVVEGNKIYIQRYYRYETNIVDSLKRMVEKSKTEREKRMAELDKQQPLITSLIGDYSTSNLSSAEKTDWQLSASLLALLNDFSIITGGPGTGKTTTLAKLLRILYAINPNARVALAAPTGKASMRMYESLQNSAKKFKEDTFTHKVQALKPYTIHALLGYIKESIYFKHNQENPLPYDWVMVDEASMIDVPMFAKLLDALGDKGRIVLLGDKDQLASVEAGSLLGDFCKPFSEINMLDANTVQWLNTFIKDNDKKITDNYVGSGGQTLSGHILQLKLSHRFLQQGVIGQLAYAVINNQQDRLTELFTQKEDENLTIDESYRDEVLEQFVKGYQAYLTEKDNIQALKKLNECRLLAAVKEGPQGLYALNKKIESLLQKQGLLKPNAGFYENRPIIVTKNNYELGIFNGDVGIIRKDDNGQLRAWFDDPEKGIKSFLPAYLNDVETVFAMTIHKSQGSEFDKVLVALPTNENNPLLTRELLYTAITRAKKSIVIQSTHSIILQTAGASVKRMSGINEKLQS